MCLLIVAYPQPEVHPMIELRDVEVIDYTDDAHVYRIDGRDVHVPTLLVMSRTTARWIGDRGTHVIPRWVAERLGLDERSTPAADARRWFGGL